jgi:hypothetical protein
MTNYLGEINSILNQQCGWAKMMFLHMKPLLGLILIPSFQIPETASADAQLSKSAWMWQLAVDFVLLWNPCMT